MRFCLVALTIHVNLRSGMPGSSIKSKFVRGLLAKWGWATRGVTLGVRAVVIDADGRILLVRHGYAPGWHMPGGAVDPGETIAQAAVRELAEETGVVGDASSLRLHGLFFNPAFGGRDHVAVLRVERFTLGPEPAPNREIAERGWFDLDTLPDGITPATLRRIDEIRNSLPVSVRW